MAESGWCPDAAQGRVLTRRGTPQVVKTPLHLAAKLGHGEVAKVLVDVGADKNATTQVRERRGGDIMCWGVESRLLADTC